MDNFDLRKYLAENKLLKEEEFKLYTTNVEYDTGEDGYMYQLVDAETGEENEIGFDQLHFDRDDNLLKLGVDFNDYEQTSYQEEEVSKEEALKIYSELLSENKLLKEEIMVDTTVMVDPNNTLMSNASDEEIDYIKANITNVPKMSVEDFQERYDEYFDRFYSEGDPLDLQIKALQIHIDKGVLTREEAINRFSVK